MARTLIQLQGTPAIGHRGSSRSAHSGGAHHTWRETDLIAASPSSSGGLRPGFGLLLAAGISLGLWAGLTKLAVAVLR